MSFVDITGRGYGRIQELDENSLNITSSKIASKEYVDRKVLESENNVKQQIKIMLMENDTMQKLADRIKTDVMKEISVDLKGWYEIIKSSVREIEIDNDNISSITYFNDKGNILNTSYATMYADSNKNREPLYRYPQRNIVNILSIRPDIISHEEILKYFLLQKVIFVTKKEFKILKSFM
jgi:hypothetical protein